MQHSDLEIVRADLSQQVHRKALVELIDAYTRDIMGGGQALEETVKRDLPDALSRRSSCHVVLAFVDGRAVGLSISFEAFLTFACCPILNIHDFFVVLEFRGQGIARQMLDVIEGIASRLGCCKLTLEVLEGNTRASGIYQRFGFEAYELDPTMGRALFLEKKLDG